MSRSGKAIAAILALMGLALCAYIGVREKNRTPAVSNLSIRSADAKPSSEFLNAQRAVEYYRQEIKKNPDAAKNYVELAQLFLQEMRVTGNETEYIPKARYLLDEALNREPENENALLTKASLMLTLHQFELAKELAEHAINRNPYSAYAYGALGDALVQLGKYEEAVKATDRMLSLRPDLRSYSRSSYLWELHGDIEGAAAAMKLAADAGASGREDRAWVLYNLANLYFQQGKLDTAAYIYNGILEERPQYAYALAGLARLKGARHAHREAIELAKRAYVITPSHVFLEQLVELYQVSGERGKADSILTLIFEGYEQDEKLGANIDLEYAAFCAKHDLNAQEALIRVQSEFNRRPDNIEVLEIYAWLLHKSGKSNEAARLIERALRLKTQDVDLLFRASKIYEAAGEQKASVALYNQLLHSGLSMDDALTQDARQSLASLKSFATNQ